MMEELWSKLVDSNFSALSGSEVNLSIHVTDDLVNESIEAFVDEARDSNRSDDDASGEDSAATQLDYTRALQHLESAKIAFKNGHAIIDVGVRVQ